MKTNNQYGIGKIDRLIAERERELEGLKITRTLLYGDAKEKKQKGPNDALAAALVDEAERKPTHRPKRTTNGIKAQRRESADFLAQFDRKVPRLPRSGNGQKHMPLGVMVWRGYLIKKGDGYIRTAKPYVIDEKTPRKTPPTGHTRPERERREATVKFLAHFNVETPTPAPKMTQSRGAMLASMMRHGYLKQQGDGYVRTAKEFTLVRS